MNRFCPIRGGSRKDMRTLLSRLLKVIDPQRCLIGSACLTVWMTGVPAVSDPAVNPSFLEVSREAGFHFQQVSLRSEQKYIIETTGSGGGFLDYDRDGWIDIYVVNGVAGRTASSTTPVKNRLFRNNRDGTFTDVSEAAGVDDTSYGQGCTFGDYDNDGFVDIYVTNLGPNRLYHNNQDGTFTDVAAESGVDNPLWSSSAAFGDYDGDGYLDLYVCNYLDFSFARQRRCYSGNLPIYCYPHSYKGVPNALYRNQGDDSFREVTAEAGLREDPRYSKSLGVLWFDMDNDHDLDLYVANDTTGNYLFENQGTGSFEDISLVSGAAFGAAGAPQAGMGVDAADLDGSGRFHLLVTNFSLQNNALYWNEGSGMFADRSVESGLSGPSFLPLGFGTNFLDFDNDGLLDLFIANGHVFDNAALINPSLQYRQANQLFRHTGKGRFTEVTALAGSSFSEQKVSRGSATGDFDNDGKVDLLVTNINARVDLLKNQTQSSHHWLKFQLEGTDCNRDAIGAKVTVRAGEILLTQEVRAGNSYLSQSDLRLHFGLGRQDRVDSIRVSWPCGKEEEVSVPAKLDQIVAVKENEDESVLNPVSGRGDDSR